MNLKSGRWKGSKRVRTKKAYMRWYRQQVREQRRAYQQALRAGLPASSIRLPDGAVFEA